MSSKQNLYTLAAGLIIALLLRTPITAQELKVSRLKLDNGLVALAVEDHTVPSVAYYTVFKVGSRNERPGITGLSHLFEHMMFNGSAKFAPKVFDNIIEAGGGDSNAFTTSDRTEYQEQFSTPTLDTVIALEADRMRALKLDKQNIEQERGIVKEERRVNTDNNVGGAMNEILENSAFVAHPYHWDTIGFMKDIDAIRLEDAKEYFRIHYAPNNAVITVVGDFDTKALFAKITQLYGDIKPQPLPRDVVNSEPPQSGERRISFHKPAELPAVTFGYHTVTNRDPDNPALDLLTTILSHGESARLYRTLVYDKQIADAVSSYNDSREDPGLYIFYAQAQQGHTTAECESAIYGVLDDIRKNGVSERELQKAKNVERISFLDKFKTNLGRAGLIAEYEANRGDWHTLYDYVPAHDKVTAADIKRVVKKYFSERNRTVVTLIPEKNTAETSGSTEQPDAKPAEPAQK